jgi:hypothetical protein
MHANSAAHARAMKRSDTKPASLQCVQKLVARTLSEALAPVTHGRAGHFAASQRGGFS